MSTISSASRKHYHGNNAIMPCACYVRSKHFHVSSALMPGTTTIMSAVPCAHDARGNHMHQGFSFGGGGGGGTNSFWRCTTRTNVYS